MKTTDKDKTMASPKPVSKPLKDSGGHVRVKPAAKNVPNPPNEAKAGHKFNDTRGRAYNNAAKEYEAGAGRHGNMYEMQDAAREASANAQTGRKANIVGKKLVEAERNKATTPRTTPDTAWSTKKPIQIRTSGLQGKSGAFGGQHMGGHGMGGGGLNINDVNK